jgi:D-alanine-D-alanine ligase
MEKNLNNFGRIGIFMGGPSSEREISLASGQAVYEVLKNQALDVVTIDILTDSWEENCKLIQKVNIDVAFIALHGHFGEDGQIQAMLELLNIPYTGSDSTASHLAMDKIASRRIFQDAGLPVPNYVILSGGDDPKIIQNLSGPFVVKPTAQGSSIGLSIVKSEEKLNKAIDYALGFDGRVIVEEYINGREITVGILGDSALPVVEIVPQNKFYDYEAKYKPGMSDYIVPAKLSDKITAQAQDKALIAHRLLGCSGFSRVDMRLNHENIPFILEVNSIPGLMETSLLPKAARAMGIDFAQLCIQILRLTHERVLGKIT